SRVGRGVFIVRLTRMTFLGSLSRKRFSRVG
ncbi:MAG: hypothetical protein ACJA1R_002576, partial [Flavobacteriales bacterium]